MTDQHKGPLAGVRVIEFCSIGPGPHCAMLLSDMGADILRIDKPGGNGWPNPIMDRGRHTVVWDIRTEEGRNAALEAVAYGDVLIEGFRPGVMERLGLGPDELSALNPRLIYARMTGWGQTGPLAKAAGHDINYIALTGALAAITADDGQPTPPLNLLGDFGGGSLFLALGIVSALFERTRSGKGQVVDAAILDGVASLMTMFAGLLPGGAISLDPSKNVLGGRAPFYRCYACADGKYVSVGALEPRFYREMLARVGAQDELREEQYTAANWFDRIQMLAALFAAKGQAEWCGIFEGSDACFAPVLSYEESISHPHMQARAVYIEAEGLTQAAPAPRFSRTPSAIRECGDGAALLSIWRSADSQTYRGSDD